MIFGPAMRIMSRLRFRALKLGLIGALFMTPLCVLVYLTYARTSADIQVAERERLGVLEIVPARFRSQAVQEHRGTSQLALSGDSAAKDKLAAIANKVAESSMAFTAPWRAT